MAAVAAKGHRGRIEARSEGRRRQDDAQRPVGVEQFGPGIEGLGDFRLRIALRAPVAGKPAGEFGQRRGQMTARPEIASVGAQRADHREIGERGQRGRTTFAGVANQAFIGSAADEAPRRRDRARVKETNRGASVAVWRRRRFGARAGTPLFPSRL